MGRASRVSVGDEVVIYPGIGWGGDEAASADGFVLVGALLGALLGVAGAYVVLVATYYDDLGYLSHVPVRYLALAVLGVPLAVAAAGWALAGREPPAIARPVLE